MNMDDIRKGVKYRNSTGKVRLVLSVHYGYGCGPDIVEYRNGVFGYRNSCSLKTFSKWAVGEEREEKEEAKLVF